MWVEKNCFDSFLWIITIQLCYLYRSAKINNGYRCPLSRGMLAFTVNCTKFGQLILRKIIKIIATRCQILRLKCTKFDFGWGSAPDPAEGAYRGYHAEFDCCWSNATSVPRVPPFKVTQGHPNWQIDWLTSWAMAFSYRFQDKRRLRTKYANLFLSRVFSSPLRGYIAAWNFATRDGLKPEWRIYYTRQKVWKFVQPYRYNKRRMDRQTDRNDISVSRCAW